MKKIILLVSVVLFGCVGYAQAQTSEKKLSRQERKEAKRAMEQALFEEAKQNCICLFKHKFCDSQW